MRKAFMFPRPTFIAWLLQIRPAVVAIYPERVEGNMSTIRLETQSGIHLGDIVSRFEDEGVDNGASI